MTEWSHKLKISEENASFISYIKSSLKMAYCDDIKNSKISKATKVSCVFEIRKLKPISLYPPGNKTFVYNIICHFTVLTIPKKK